MFLFILGLACSDYSLQEKGAGNGLIDDESDFVEPTEHPNIVVQPSPLIFSNVLKDCASEPIVVTVSNRGYETLDVSDISFVSDQSGSFSHNGQPFSLSFESYYSHAYYTEKKAD